MTKISEWYQRGSQRRDSWAYWDQGGASGRGGGGRDNCG